MWKARGQIGNEEALRSTDHRVSVSRRPSRTSWNRRFMSEAKGLPLGTGKMLSSDKINTCAHFSVVNNSQLR